MTPSEGDLRVRRTRKLLREALLELIEERGFEALTVGELTARAMVSRAAFYRNYQDKYDLVERIFEEAMSALLSAVGELGREHPTESWVRFFEHIADYERLYRVLLGSKGSPWFARNMRAALAGLVAERGRLPHGPDAGAHAAHTFSDAFVPEIVAAMFVETITWWLEHGRPYPPKEIATRAALLAAAIFSGSGYMVTRPAACRATTPLPVGRRTGWADEDGGKTHSEPLPQARCGMRERMG